MNFELNNRIKMLNPYSNVDVLYGPYDSLEEALSSIPQELRAQGLTIGVINQTGKIEEYWWNSKNTEDDGIAKKIEEFVSSAELIAPTVLNYVESPGSIDFLVLYAGKIGGRITVYRNGAQADQQNITVGTNAYTVTVPKEYQSYTYTVVIQDMLGNNVNMEVNSFTVKVGTITIRTDLQKQLDTTVLSSSITTYVTVSNLNNPAHLYLIDESGTTQIPGTSFTSRLLNINLSPNVGEHSFKLLAVSLNADETESTDERDEITFTYARLTENDTPYKITLDGVDEVTNAERVPVHFHYQAYDAVQKRVIFIIDGSIQIYPETYFTAFTQCKYSLDAISVGEHTLLIKIEDSVSNVVSFVVSEYTIDEEIVKTGMVFLFDSVASEASGEYKLEYSNISDGVNGVDTENKLIKLSGESYAVLTRNGNRINPFSLQNTNGSTIELLYNTKCVGNLDAPVMTTFENKNDTSYGVEVTYKQISVGLNGALRHTVDVSENTWIHATVVFSKTGFESDEIEGGYAYIYINGCIVTVSPLQQLPTANVNAYLSLNVDNELKNFGECNIKTLRFYNRPLSPSEVVLNYINSIDDSEEKEEARGRNSLNLPTITFTEKSNNTYHFEDLLNQVDKSLQKKQLVNCETTYLANSTALAVVWQNTTVGTQGTSTLQFPIKNFKLKIYLDSDNKIKAPQQFLETEGWDEEYVYTLKCDYMESSHLNNTPTCTFYNNLIDQLIASDQFTEWTVDTVSPARAGYINEQGERRYYSDGTNIKYGYFDAIKGFPCVVKYIDLYNTQHYLGTYMFNLDKESNSLGFDVYYKNSQNQYVQSECVSIEGKSNTDEGAGSFCSFDYWLDNKSGYNSSTGQYDPNNGYYSFEYNNYYIKDSNIIAHNKTFDEFILYYVVDNPGEDFYVEAGNLNARHLISVLSQNSYYNQDFETRYIYNEDYETQPEFWHNWIEVVNFVSSSYEEVSNPETSLERINQIKQQFERYFSLNYCLLYYLLMIVFAQVDNAGKNCMWDTWDGVKWFPRPYDLDTMGGLNNSGLENIDPDVEYNRQGSPGNYVDASASLVGADIIPDINENYLNERRYSKFNTSGSRMWVLFKLLYDSQIKDLYRRLRDNKKYDVENIIDFYFSQTSDIIGETYYNKDSVAKFIQQSYLDQLHGNRRERFRYWITNRIKFCDSLFEYNRTQNNLIRLRINPTSTANIVVKVYNPIYIYIVVGTITGGSLTSDAVYNFYCSPESRYENGKEGVKITIPITSGDKEVSIFGADSIKEIEGLSNLNCTSIDFLNASKITTVELYDMTKLNELTFGSNAYLLTLIGENLTGISTSLDLTNASNIKTVSLRGSTFNNLSLTTDTTGTTVKTVDISNTSIQQLQIKKAPFLQQLNVNGCQSLQTLVLDDCDIEELAFSSLNSLRHINFIGCHKLRSVDIKDLSYFELDNNTFSNCENIESINMRGVYNRNQALTTLSIESLMSLRTLDLSNTQGIYRIGFDTNRLATLESLNVENSQLNDLQLPVNSTLSYLSCYGSINLEHVSNINADIQNALVFKDCKTLKSISGTKLKSSNANQMFMGCMQLESINIDDIDFTEASNFIGAFSRCYELPWSEAKKVLNTDKDVNASLIFAYKYTNPNIDNMSEVPSDIFNGMPNITNLSYAFTFGGRNDEYSNNYAIPSGYQKINKINTFAILLNKVTNLDVFACSTNIEDLPDLSRFPNATTMRGSFCNTAVKVIPENVFEYNTELTSINAVFYNCKSITSDIGNILSTLVALTDANGAFYNSTIKGTIPRGFFKNNTNLISAAIMFAGSNITGLNPLFLNEDSAIDSGKIYKLLDIASMFANSKLSGSIPDYLFYGCNTLTNAGRWASRSITTTGGFSVSGGVFAGTSITNVPSDLFDYFENVTTTQGMFLGCKSALFPTTINQLTQQPEPYSFLTSLTKVTNLGQMFAGCTNFNLPIADNFIPSSATNINGIFAYSNIPTVKSLNYLTRLTSAVGAYASTPITSYPANLFANLRNLTNISYFFKDCFKLNMPIPDSLFDDCENLTNVSSMFSFCEWMGAGSSTNTIPEGLFKNNLNLENVSSMFEYCVSLYGIIPLMFKNESNSPYTKLTNVSRMFYHAVVPAENNHIFEQEFLYNLPSVTNASRMFFCVNSRANVGNNTTHSTFLLYPDSLFKSSFLKNVEGIFGYSNLTGSIDNNLFRGAIYSLNDISEAFIATKITSVGSNFMLATETGTNEWLTSVACAFRETANLSSNIPACNDKAIFKNIQTDASAFKGYAYNTNATNKTLFSGLWVESGQYKTGYPASPGSYTRRATESAHNSYSATDARLGI